MSETVQAAQPARRRRAISSYRGVQAVAETLAMSERWVRGKIASGELEACRFGCKLVVSEASLNDFIDRHKLTQA